MKKISKIAAILLAVVLTVCMSGVAVFADTTPFSATAADLTAYSKAAAQQSASFKDGAALINGYLASAGYTVTKTADQLFANAVACGPIADMGAVAGIGVYREGSVGVFVGSDTVVTVQNGKAVSQALSAGGWTDWFLVFAVNYGNIYRKTGVRLTVAQMVNGGVTWALAGDRYFALDDKNAALNGTDLLCAVSYSKAKNPTKFQQIVASLGNATSADLSAASEVYTVVVRYGDGTKRVTLPDVSGLMIETAGISSDGDLQYLFTNNGAAVTGAHLTAQTVPESTQRKATFAVLSTDSGYLYFFPCGADLGTGSILSEGSLWLIIAIAAVVIIAVVVIAVVMKKKKATTAPAENA